MAEPASQAPSPALAAPPGHPRFPLMDGLRGMAFIGIILVHAGGYTAAYTAPHWGGGVARLNLALVLFCSLSGFLMYRPFVAARRLGAPAIKVGDYGRRRVLRIIPGYWVALTLLTIYPGLWAVTEDPWYYYGFLQGLPGLRPDSECAIGCGIPVAWSLGVEATFYLLLPLYAFAVARLTRGASHRRWFATETLAITALGILSLVLSVISPGEIWFARSSLTGAFVWFTAGMLLAVVSVSFHGREESSGTLRLVTARPWIPWILAAGLFVLLSRVGGDPDADFIGETDFQTLSYQVLGVAIVGLLMLPAVFGDGAGGLVRRFLANPLLVWLGVISYGGYLYHLLVMGELDYRGAGEWLGSHEFIALSVSSLVISSLFGAASYYFVERPFLRLKNRRLTDVVRSALARGRRGSASTP